MLLPSILGFDRRAGDGAVRAEFDLALTVCLAVFPLALVSGAIRKNFDEIMTWVGKLRAQGKNEEENNCTSHVIGKATKIDRCDGPARGRLDALLDTFPFRNLVLLCLPVKLLLSRLLAILHLL